VPAPGSITSAAGFDRLHGRNAFLRLRSLLSDPDKSYTEIGKTFGLTRQRISQVARQLGTDSQERIRHFRRKECEWLATSTDPAPVGNRYLGLTMHESPMKRPVRAVNGQCLRCGYWFAWLVLTATEKSLMSDRAKASKSDSLNAEIAEAVFGWGSRAFARTDGEQFGNDRGRSEAP